MLVDIRYEMINYSPANCAYINSAPLGPNFLLLIWLKNESPVETNFPTSVPMAWKLSAETGIIKPVGAQHHLEFRDNVVYNING